MAGTLSFIYIYRRCVQFTLFRVLDSVSGNLPSFYCSFPPFVRSNKFQFLQSNSIEIAFELQKRFQIVKFNTMDPNELITADTDFEELVRREYTVDASIPRDSPITEFYAGKTVFLTGPTGFLGHLLLEKLLR